MPPLDNNVSGASAVYRNLRAVFVPDNEVEDNAKRVVVCDREYTSYTLVQTLLQNGFYCVGTCMPTRLGTIYIYYITMYYFIVVGFPAEITWPKNAKIARGAYNVAVDKIDPRIAATAWKDNSKVYFLSSGQSTEPDSCLRRSKTGPHSYDVPCPKLVNTYNEYMNGADVHDQKRLQR